MTALIRIIIANYENNEFAMTYSYFLLKRLPSSDSPFSIVLNILYSSSSFKTLMKASCGTSTEPTCLIRFLPSFCFSRSFFLREISPP